jgi:hypothetical protein
MEWDEDLQELMDDVDSELETYKQDSEGLIKSHEAMKREIEESVNKYKNDPSFEVKDTHFDPEEFKRRIMLIENTPKPERKEIKLDFGYLEALQKVEQENDLLNQENKELEYQIQKLRIKLSNDVDEDDLDQLDEAI